MDNMKLNSRMNGKVQELQQPVDVVEVTSDMTLAPMNSGYLALNNSAIDIIRENLKNQPLSYDLFDVVKSPSGGATVFEVPGLAGAKAEKELIGIILDYVRFVP